MCVHFIYLFNCSSDVDFIQENGPLLPSVGIFSLPFAVSFGSVYSYSSRHTHMRTVSADDRAVSR